MGHRELNEIQQDINNAEAALANAGKSGGQTGEQESKLKDLRAEMIEARTASYPQELIDAARARHLKVENYGDEATLERELFPDRYEWIPATFDATGKLIEDGKFVKKA